MVPAITLLVITATAAAREGFGFTKRAVQMTRTRPPAASVAGARIRVEAISTRCEESDEAESLRALTSSAITAGDSGMAESGRPDLVVHLTLERLGVAESWETKTDHEYQQTGTKDEWNVAKSRYEKKAVYGNVPVTKHFKIVQGTVAGTYAIVDAKGGVLESGAIDQDSKRRYEGGEKASTREMVINDLLRAAAQTVARRIVPARDRVVVVLPKGSFESFIPLAEAGKWDEYLAVVLAVPELRGRDQEAYRQYALAVAKEGVAYGMDDRVKAAKLLGEALAHFHNALEYNPDESLFREPHVSLFGAEAGSPLLRLEASVRAYEAWAVGRVKGEE